MLITNNRLVVKKRFETEKFNIVIETMLLYWINTNNIQMIKNWSENNLNSGKNMHLYFTIKSSFFVDEINN